MTSMKRLGLGAALLAFFSALAGFGPQNHPGWKFPVSFLWGVATAAHQIEGNNTHSDWWEWEQQCHLPNCEKSGVADDGYHRFDSDAALAQGLGAGAYRLSIEWARVEPQSGVFSEEEFAHYREVLRSVHAHGMKVVLTLQHFTLPLWVAHHAPAGQNSWLDPALPALFARYTDKVVAELGDQVDYWITINEPTVNMLTGYVVGVSPPGIQDIQKAPIALANFLKAHAQAYHAIHRAYPRAMVSVAHHARVFDAFHAWNPLDQAVAGFLHDFWNHQFLRAIQTGKIHFNIPFVVNYEENAPEIRGTLDYLGVNYYTRDLIQFDASSPQKFTIQPNLTAPKTDVGWEIYPHGFYRVLQDLRQYGYPIFITENGLADAPDLQRGHFICDHLREVQRAMEDGVPVIGYLHWSLYDNFEWSNGYAPRFGLASVNYETQERTLRPSAQVYARVIASRSLEACGSL